MTTSTQNSKSSRKKTAAIVFIGLSIWVLLTHTKDAATVKHQLTSPLVPASVVNDLMRPHIIVAATAAITLLIEVLFFVKKFYIPVIILGACLLAAEYIIVDVVFT